MAAGALELHSQDTGVPRPPPDPPAARLVRGFEGWLYSPAHIHPHPKLAEDPDQWWETLMRPYLTRIKEDLAARQT